MNPTSSAARPLVQVIDDDPMAALIVRQSLDGTACTVEAETTGRRGLQRLHEQHADVVVLDHVLPDMEGIEILQTLHQQQPGTPVIFVTSQRTASIAIQAMKLGAFDYLTKPLDVGHLRRQIDRALELRRTLSSPEMQMRSPASSLDQGRDLVGECPSMQTVFKAIGKVASRDMCVLIRGKPGTGKESVARAIHDHSRSADGPFVKLHCPSYDLAGLERELFGEYFSESETNPPSRLQQAAGGTLLLQEIGSTPLSIQSKLLNTIRDGFSDENASGQARGEGCRVVASSSHDLETLVCSGKFRSDLYYLLSSYVIHLPPLRQRHGDVKLLIEHLLPTLHSGDDPCEGPPLITDEALRLLCQHPWPGNIDELRSVLCQAIAESKNNIVLPECLAGALRSDPLVADEANSTDRGNTTHWDEFARLRMEAGAEDLYEQAIQETDRKLMARVLHHTSGNQAQAARILGITRASLRKKLRQLGVEAKHLADLADR